jgi:hypothetical protein
MIRQPGPVFVSKDVALRAHVRTEIVSYLAQTTVDVWAERERHTIWMSETYEFHKLACFYVTFQNVSVHTMPMLQDAYRTSKLQNIKYCKTPMLQNVYCYTHEVH